MSVVTKPPAPPAPTVGGKTAPEPSPNSTKLIVPMKVRGPIIYSVFAVIALLAFGILGQSAGESNFGMSVDTDFIQISDFTVPSKATGIVCGLLLLALAVLSWWFAVTRRKAGAWLPGIFGVIWIFSFLTWAIASVSATLQIPGLLQGSLFLAVPLIFGSLSGVLCERSGVVNVAIEGQLLAGAFLAALVASMTENPWLGLVVAPLAGALVSLLLTLFSIKYVVNQIIVGVVINVLIAGLTTYLYSTVMQRDPSHLNKAHGLPRWNVPVLSEIPIIGPVLFKQTVVVYLMYVVLIVVQIMLFRSKWGLRTRAIGEHPKAADTVGLKVNAMRFRNVILAGMVAGLGGAFFTVGQNLAFGKEMTAGKGFIALAAMIFGRWSPVGALGAALLFGFADNLQSVLTVMGTPIPSEIMLMVPYLATIFAVAGLVGRSRGPAAAGEPYIKA